MDVPIYLELHTICWHQDQQDCQVPSETFYFILFLGKNLIMRWWKPSQLLLDYINLDHKSINNFKDTKEQIEFLKEFN
jgi:hypothetical protein